MNTYRRLPKALTALQAAENAPTIAKLGGLIKESTDRLRAIEPLLPAALRVAVKSGPIDDQGWCLLVNSPAVAAKLRQLIPAINHHLTLQHHRPLPIRLKIMVGKR